MFKFQVRTDCTPRTKNGQPIAWNHLAHGIHEQWQRQYRAKPEPSPHVVEFGSVLLANNDTFRLQRHAADGAAGIAHVAYIRVHRARVDHALVAQGHQVVLAGWDVFRDGVVAATV
jgi:hypothetical protein